MWGTWIVHNPHMPSSFNIRGVFSVRSTINHDAAKRLDHTCTLSHDRNQINEVTQSSSLDFAVGVLS